MKSARIPLSRKLIFNWPKNARIPNTFVMFLFSCVYIIVSTGQLSIWLKHLDSSF